jgi:hypothetical protein
LIDNQSYVGTDSFKKTYLHMKHGVLCRKKFMSWCTVYLYLQFYTILAHGPLAKLRGRGLCFLSAKQGPHSSEAETPRTPTVKCPRTAKRSQRLLSQRNAFYPFQCCAPIGHNPSTPLLYACTTTQSLFQIPERNLSISPISKESRITQSA